MEKEEPIKQFFIPDNYSGDINIGGQNLNARNLFEGIVFGCLLQVITWIIASRFLNTPSTVGISVAVGGAAALLGIKGYKNESYSELFQHYLKFRKEKRICYYNTRPKFEAKPIDLQNDNLESEILLRKQAQDLKNKLLSGNTTFNQGDRPDNLFFEEDVGIVETPSNYEGYDKEVKKKRKEKRTNGKKKKQKKKKAK